MNNTHSSEPNEAVLLKEYEQAVGLSKELGLSARQNTTMFVALISAFAAAVFSQRLNPNFIIIASFVVGFCGLLLGNHLHRNQTRSKAYTTRAKEIEKMVGMHLLTNGAQATHELRINVSNRGMIITVVVIGSGVAVAYAFFLLISMIAPL
jgi:hypothetical protein